MVCPYCQNQIADGTAFCSACRRQPPVGYPPIPNNYGAPQPDNSKQSRPESIPANQYESYTNSAFGNGVPKAEIHNPKGPIQLADMTIKHRRWVGSGRRYYAGEPDTNLFRAPHLANAVVDILGLVSFIFGLFCLWRLFTRAGYSGWMSLWILVPGLGGLIILGVLVFGNWPVLREVNELRQQLGMQGPQYPGGNPPYPGGGYGGPYPPRPY
jgi:hypothetical protein